MEHTKKQFTWGFVLLTLGLMPLLHSGCSKAKGGSDDDDDVPKAGYVTGTAKDQAGKPLAGTRIIIDHSIFFNANISTLTNGQGKYAVKVPTGSWYAFAIQEVAYNGKTYSFYLHPDNPAGFSGEGAVRNFVWKLSGTKPQPLSGNYGGLVTIDHFPGVYIDDDKIDFVFTPLGPLIDGSQGEVLRLRAEDAYTIKDIPIGRYRLTATYEGKPVLFRRRNSDETFVEDYELNFEPQLAAQCDNCAALEYYLGKK
ncbi:carboxypeptidase regulatory-like domain-containing protein [Parapedobacter defluvii]|uniref:carboxypeptidase-like regulatory domain-containing protein n=1 Tax=Parapedobacter defluvii TaxID=2045106 RepID=UPI003341F42C